MAQRNSLNKRVHKLAKGGTNGNPPATPFMRTYLDKEQESNFNEWYARLAKMKNWDSNPDTQFYDLRGFYKDQPIDAVQMLYNSPDTHFPDTYKLPDHPTFSNESKYVSDQHPAKGYWKGEEFIKMKRGGTINNNMVLTRRNNSRRKYLQGGGTVDPQYDLFTSWSEDNVKDKRFDKNFSDTNRENFSRYSDLYTKGNYNFSQQEFEDMQKGLDFINEEEQYQNKSGDKIATLGALGASAIPVVGKYAAGAIENFWGNSKDKMASQYGDKYRDIFADYQTQYDKFQQDKAQTSNLNNNQVPTQSVFKRGGRLYLQQGGQFQPISDNLEAINGPSHQQGGVDLGGGVEGEGGEVIKDGNKVFSDVTKMVELLPEFKDKNITVADFVKQIGKEKEDLKTQAGSTNVYDRGSVARTLEIKDKQLEQVFAAQEKFNQANGFDGQSYAARGTYLDFDPTRPIVQRDPDVNRYELLNNNNEDNPVYRINDNTSNLQDIISANNPAETANYKSNNSNNLFASGFENINIPQGALKDVAGSAIPLIDNIVNARIANNRPQIPTRQSVDPIRLNKNVTIDKTDIDRFESSSLRGIQKGSSSGATANINAQSVRNKALEERGKRFGQETNLRNDLSNKEIEINKNLEKLNKDNQFSDDYLRMQRLAEIQDMKSANAANLSEDLQHEVYRSDLKEYQNKQLEYAYLSTKDTATWTNYLKSGDYDFLVKKEGKAGFDALEGTARRQAYLDAAKKLKIDTTGWKI